MIGLVALWGTIVEHELGYRARLGYPIAIQLVCPICFWQRGLDGSQEPTVVAVFHRSRPMPLCSRHVETAVEANLGRWRLVAADELTRALARLYGVEARIPVVNGASRPRTGRAILGLTSTPMQIS